MCIARREDTVLRRRNAAVFARTFDGPFDGLREVRCALRARLHPSQSAPAAGVCQNLSAAEKIDPGQETQKWRLRPSRVNPKIKGNPFSLFDSIFLEPPMSHATLNSSALRTPSSSSTANNAMRELFSAMPIVIFYKAARAALMQRRSAAVQR
jgi:hypothetical protein